MPKKIKGVNKYNLSRYIPASVSREVRKKCGFGCVVCGNGLYQYEHFDPPFAEAHSHDANGIILLCGACHDRKTRKFLSEQTVAIHASSPKALQTLNASSPTDIGIVHPRIILGRIDASGVETILEMFEENLFSILKPEIPGGPFRISAKFFDLDQKLILEIKENQCLTPTDNWDVEMINGRIIVRRKTGKISLIMRFESPEKIVVEHLEMYYRGYLIKCIENQDMTIEKEGKSPIVFGGFAKVKDCKVAVRLGKSGFEIGVGGQRSYSKNPITTLGRSMPKSESRSYESDSSDRITSPKNTAINSTYIDYMKIGGLTIKDCRFDNCGSAVRIDY
jgi:hypothetical protein